MNYTSYTCTSYLSLFTHAPTHVCEDDVEPIWMQNNPPYKVAPSSTSCLIFHSQGEYKMRAAHFFQRSFQRLNNFVINLLIYFSINHGYFILLTFCYCLVLVVSCWNGSKIKRNRYNIYKKISHSNCLIQKNNVLKFKVNKNIVLKLKFDKKCWFKAHLIKNKHFKAHFKDRINGFEF